MLSSFIMSHRDPCAFFWSSCLSQQAWAWPTTPSFLKFFLSLASVILLHLDTAHNSLVSSVSSAGSVFPHSWSSNFAAPRTLFSVLFPILTYSSVIFTSGASNTLNWHVDDFTDLSSIPISPLLCSCLFNLFTCLSNSHLNFDMCKTQFLISFLTLHACCFSSQLPSHKTEVVFDLCLSLPSHMWAISIHSKCKCS